MPAPRVIRQPVRAKANQLPAYFPGRGETADQFTAQRCRELLTKAIGEPIDVEIIDVAPWDVLRTAVAHIAHQAIAEPC